MTVLDGPPVIEPVAIGPTWSRGDDGKFRLPDLTLGWQALGWAADYLQHEEGGPWRYTAEQARFLLWWYAIDEHGKFVYRDGVLQRLKGWGKDPFAATLSAIEFVGPCRFSHFDDDGEPVARSNPQAWIQIAAVSKDQTRSTMTLFPAIFTKRCLAAYGIDLGKEIIYAESGRRRIEAVTSSPRALEGTRASLVIRNETHHWLLSNEGHEMDRVISRNAVKSKGAGARALSLTNAYEPSEDSVAQRAREAYEEQGESLGLLYDSLEAPPEASLNPVDAPAVVRAVRGDSVWLDVDNIVKELSDLRNAPSMSRRWWYNQIVAAEDAWIDPKDFDACLADGNVPPLVPGDEVTLFLDCSKSDDATGLVACRLSDGLVHVVQMWQRPPKGRPGHDGYTIPRHAVDQAVASAFENYKVAAFFGDPGHLLEDESQERFWDGFFDEWHRAYSKDLEVWAKPGQDGHAVMWDMTSSRRSEQFTAAAERCEQEITEHVMLHDGDHRLRSHARNCKRYPNKWGVSVWKGHRESQRKIDLAVCMIGARMVRRLVLNNPNRKRRRTGKVW